MDGSGNVTEDGRLGIERVVDGGEVGFEQNQLGGGRGILAGLDEILGCDEGELCSGTGLRRLCEGRLGTHQEGEAKLGC